MRVAGVVVASVVMIGLVGVPASHAQAPAREVRPLSVAGPDVTAEPVDPDSLEPDSSITSTEDPGEVVARADRILGDRFVTIAVDENQQAFTVHVLNLDASEVDGLAKSIRGKYPVQFVNATVSRADVDRLAEIVTKYADANPGVLQMFGAAYNQSAVKVVAADPETLAKALDGIRATAGAEARLTQVSEDRVAVSGFTAPLVTDTWKLTEEESNTDSPYRAGGSLRVASGSFNCTTGFLMKLNGLAYGSTAGHCGQNAGNEQRPQNPRNYAAQGPVR